VDDVLTGFQVPLADSTISLFSPTPAPLNGLQTYYLGKGWCFGTITVDPTLQDAVNTSGPDERDPGFECDGSQLDNISQTDILTGNITFSAIQSRNNPDYVCVQIGVGNEAIDRPVVDTRTNFAIVDTNHPVNGFGVLTEFYYYAANTNPFRFIVVDQDLEVKWVSDEITPPGAGLFEHEPTNPPWVQTGWNVGLYFASTGTIPFTNVGEPAAYTPGGYGVPVVGTNLTVDGTSNRTYSFYAGN
jgi:hypothetical protein